MITGTTEGTCDASQKAKRRRRRGVDEPRHGHRNILVEHTADAEAQRMPRAEKTRMYIASDTDIRSCMCGGRENGREKEVDGESEGDMH